MRRGLVIISLFTLALAACTADTEGTSTTGPGTTIPGVTTTTTGAVSTTAAPPVTRPDLEGLEGLPIGVRQQLEDLMVSVQEIRGLSFLSTPKVTVVSEDELADRVMAEIRESSEDLPADEALYKLLGLLGPEVDLESLLLELYGEQVAGFYDGDSQEIVVPARDDGLTILQQGAMFHELVHALVDQHYGFDARFKEMLDSERLDEATAYQALIEGDAVFAETLWVRTLSQRELGELIAESVEIDTTVLFSSPLFIRDTLLFPYDSGLAFVQQIYDQRGWAAVNDAYHTMPDMPGSTEQVITPDDFGRDLPLAVDVLDVELPGYSLERNSVWGEQGFRVMLDQELGQTVGARAADGWGGDYYSQWFDGANAALLIVYKGDTTAELEELRTALLTFARQSVPEEDFVWVEEEGGLLYFIAADETSAGELIRSSVGLG